MHLVPVEAVLPGALVAFLVGCGSSGGGSGDDEVRLFNMRAAKSANPALQFQCELDGFVEAYIWTVEYEGDVRVGDRGFERFTFLPSGQTNVTDEPLTAAGAGSGIGPNEIGDTGCYTAVTDTRIEIEFYLVTQDGVRSNTVSDTFNAF